MTLPEPVPGLTPGEGALLDRFGRVHELLRVSVTDRCNFRCTYCMPAEGLPWLPRKDVLSSEEIGRLVGIFAGLGVTRVRLTGGEPTLRGDILEIVRLVAETPGIADVSMTTNAHRMGSLAGELAKAGLNRINVSLDAVDPAVFAKLTRGADVVAVLAGIDAAREAGLTPVKINCVMVAGENEDELHALVERFAPHAATTQLRFIEAMPFVGNGSLRRHVPVRSLRERLAERWTLVPVAAKQGGGPATHVRLEECGLVVGFISPITEHFCQACNRLRLQADGHLRTCLSRDRTPSLRTLMAEGANDLELAAAIRGMVWQKVAGHEADEAGGFRAFEGVMTRVGG